MYTVQRSLKCPKFGIVSRVLYTFTILDIIHSSVECSQICTVSTLLYTVHSLVQCPQFCTVSTDVYSVHSCVKCPKFCTVSTGLYRFQSVQQSPPPLFFTVTMKGQPVTVARQIVASKSRAQSRSSGLQMTR